MIAWMAEILSIARQLPGKGVRSCALTDLLFSLFKVSSAAAMASAALARSTTLSSLSLHTTTPRSNQCKRALVSAFAPAHSAASPASLGFSRSAATGGSPSLRRVVRQQSTAAVSQTREAGQARAAGLPIDLTGKKAFVAGVADDQGFGWAISKALAEAGAEIILGTWVPALGIFEKSLKMGKFDDSRKLSNGQMLEFAKVYPLDAAFDKPEDVPEDIATNKRYAGAAGFTISECAEKVANDFGKIDILVHSLANGPEVTKNLLETSRRGYLAASSASAYSFISLLQHFGPHMTQGGATVSLTYFASEKVIPGYGGGMSSAKAALESDTQVLAWEAGRKYGLRVNTISAGPLRSRAAKAIGFIDDMINYSTANAPLPKELTAEDVGNAAAFLVSPLASSITGTVLYVDNGLHVMGLAVDSPQVAKAAS
ncbi:Plastidic Enoyl-ACP Reductase [Klebsormidium nitens]|uniref:Plastidic Enoyl-ACP Reductase n=1 Tax=Klebsormidium nitens TaxID=105231 RepID=A0A1Y1IBT1_KLENI|nr:Plastidic Enoyl-ACP Reductase [Klebsormidium nitens]|eukprot:GAQ86187.1 Plastidic Enoyl-ACP Reductase [Klebsormidium nitens]